MFISRWLSGLLFPLCLVISLSAAAEVEPLTFSVVDYPPYLIVSDDGTSATGMDVEITQAAFSAVGIKADVNVLPWKRIVKLMELGSIPGTLSCSKRADRLPYMLFSDELSYVNRVAISRNDFDAGSINTIDDLSRFSVVTVDGWGMQKQLVKHNIVHQTTPDLEGAIKAIRYRDIDILYVAEFPALHYAKKFGVHQDLKVKYIGTEPKLPLHLCVSKKYPNSQEIVDKFNNGLHKIKSDGTYLEIQSKYL